MRSPVKNFVWVLALGFFSSHTWAQTTQGVIRGRVTDSQTAMPLGGPRVECRRGNEERVSVALTDEGGYYTLPLLSPGTYQVRASADRYQAYEVHEVALSVAAYLTLDCPLRPIADVWEQGAYRSFLSISGRGIAPFFGPDIDRGRTAVVSFPRIDAGGQEVALSNVMTKDLLRDLPLTGRDAYALLVLTPGVGADAGTARGLGVAVNGQRPSSSSYLLDGLENNNYLVTGPLTAVAPEAIQEYRLSNSSFSAEYGGTSGVLANAVTQGGGDRWHALAYGYLQSQKLDANNFEENRQGIRRAPLHQIQPGLTLGGPLRRDRLFLSIAFEALRSRNRNDPEQVDMPSTAYRLYTTPNSFARKVMDTYRAPLASAATLPSGVVTVEPPSSLDHRLGLARVDRVFGDGRHLLMGRVLQTNLERPDFIWTPYPDFVSPLVQTDQNYALTLISNLRPSWTSEIRAGWTRESLHWDRLHPELPTLYAGDTLLPGSPAYYAYRNDASHFELSSSQSFSRGRHLWKAGGGLLLRKIDGYLTAGRDGRYVWGDYLDFATGLQATVQTSVARASLPDYQAPSYDRSYRLNQLQGFAEDAWRAGSRLLVTAGVRYENFGSPRIGGRVPDLLVALGSGASLAEKLAGASFQSRGRGQSLYDGDNNNFAARLGVAYRLPKLFPVTLRAAYGIFYDRPFDNLWQNLAGNSVVLATARLGSTAGSSLNPPLVALNQHKSPAPPDPVPEPVLYQPGFRDAYAQNFLLGLQRSWSNTWEAQVSGLGSIGRKLVTTDQINRPYSVEATAGNAEGRFNSDLPTIAYRANQGSSTYLGMTASVQYRSAWGLAGASYTWSHAIDNQSDALAGDFFNLSFTNVGAASNSSTIAAFSRQFSSRGDRSNADFDQRHNFTIYSVWDFPANRISRHLRPLFQGWKLAEMAAFRSGFPYSVTTSAGSRETGLESFYSQRADLLDPKSASIRQPVDGGYQVLNPAAFGFPPGSMQGNLGRNAFFGPGFLNLDASLSRQIPLRRLRESASLTIRIETFNLLNHANLGSPDSSLESDSFGIAARGRVGAAADFPALIPFAEFGRRLQVMLRLQF